MHQFGYEQEDKPACEHRLHNRFHLKKVEARCGCAQGQSDRQQQIAQRIEDGRLRVRQVGVAAKGMRVPQRQPQRSQRLHLKEAEIEEMVGEVPVGEGAQAKQQGRVEERYGCAKPQCDGKPRPPMRPHQQAVNSLHEPACEMSQLHGYDSK